MPSLNERQALTLGALILLGLATLTAAVPVVGYILLALLILGVLALVGGFAAMWWQTRWQPLDEHPERQVEPVMQDREVA
jgi:uncharacterized membrane protein YqjE